MFKRRIDSDDMIVWIVASVIFGLLHFFSSTMVLLDDIPWSVGSVPITSIDAVRYWIELPWTVNSLAIQVIGFIGLVGALLLIISDPKSTFLEASKSFLFKDKNGEGSEGGIFLAQVSGMLVGIFIGWIPAFIIALYFGISRWILFHNYTKGQSFNQYLELTLPFAWPTCAAYSILASPILGFVMLIVYMVVSGILFLFFYSGLKTDDAQGMYYSAHRIGYVTVLMICLISAILLGSSESPITDQENVRLRMSLDVNSRNLEKKVRFFVSEENIENLLASLNENEVSFINDHGYRNGKWFPREIVIYVMESYMEQLKDVALVQYITGSGSYEAEIKAYAKSLFYNSFTNEGLYLLAIQSTEERERAISLINDNNILLELASHQGDFGSAYSRLVQDTAVDHLIALANKTDNYSNVWKARQWVYEQGLMTDTLAKQIALADTARLRLENQVIIANAWHFWIKSASNDDILQLLKENGNFVKEASKILIQRAEMDYIREIVIGNYALNEKAYNLLLARHDWKRLTDVAIHRGSQWSNEAAVAVINAENPCYDCITRLVIDHLSEFCEMAFARLQSDWQVGSLKLRQTLRPNLISVQENNGCSAAAATALLHGGSLDVSGSCKI
ncbi:MAG: hypothetical protein ABIG43_01810 [Chloroflexota bacterium]